MLKRFKLKEVGPSKDITAIRHKYHKSLLPGREESNPSTLPYYKPSPINKPTFINSFTENSKHVSFTNRQKLLVIQLPSTHGAR